MERRSAIGSTLVERWESAPDQSPFWRAAFGDYPTIVIETFRRIPRRLLEAGEAITWASIRRATENFAKQYSDYRRLVQHIYFAIYMMEFDLRTLAELPYAHVSFGHDSGDLFYNYTAIRVAVEVAGLWDYLLDLAPIDVVHLRECDGYFRFRDAFRSLCDEATAIYALRDWMAIPSDELALVFRDTAILERTAAGQTALLLEAQSQEWIEAAGERLAATAALGIQRMNESKRRARGFREARLRLRGKPGGRRVDLAIFVALKEEREILTGKWGLKGVKGEHGRWEGELLGKSVLVYTGERMGRVPAAVATARLAIDQIQADLIVVAGIAGGFAKPDHVDIGTLLVPHTVVDLALRKIQGDDARIRPDPYQFGIGVSLVSRQSIRSGGMAR